MESQTKQLGGTVKQTPPEISERAIKSPRYTHNKAVEIQMLEDDYLASQKNLIGVSSNRDIIETTMHAINSNDGPRRIGDATTFEQDEVKKLEQDKINNLEKEVDHLTAANQALQKRHPGEREQNEENRKESKHKLAFMMKRFSLLEKVAPKIP